MCSSQSVGSDYGKDCGPTGVVSGIQLGQRVGSNMLGENVSVSIGLKCLQAKKGGGLKNWSYLIRSF